ncbi:MAG: class I SAM-dependent methyltransferase [Xanthomonadales bacterium]|jgi:SAM-dependent methyltransferase|nr:class I SAM-dependent methyltransferase [Xanthomonadales bacterium]MDH3924858.1 class I SAM-dependent methyltransferase [Xanthomonadales bacterium]MDH4001784.1 class I SAM-dependent methyltransferase [Xanthomonadales bacterium]
MDYLEMNRESWNQRAEVHFGSRFYDVEGFLAGHNSLREIELAELTDVEGRRLLHLQCHFGLDTLSWARLGAECTGVDISPVAIDKARQLNQRAGLNAQFVCTDVYNYSRGDAAPFDIVFTSYGTVCWLPDLDQWAQLVASNLVAGGTFYMAEFHPVYDLLTGYSYFEQDEPDVEEEETYTENSGDLKTPLAVWPHPMGRVVNALVDAGIAIQRLNEYPFSPYNCFKGMAEREPGRYYITHEGQDVPLVYTIKGQKV